MATSSRKVIVFGPTGAVGSAAALTAASLGCTVVLAMRDTSKPIPGLPAEDSHKHTRVTADLTQPATVRDAVASTGATDAAFIYLAHGLADHMRGTIAALNDAGVKLIVFLSSFTVRGHTRAELEAVGPAEVIPYLHARVEMSLLDVVGKEGFVAVRPGSFAGNTMRYRRELRAGGKEKIKIFRPESYVDCIVQEDIGRVCGYVLAQGPPQDGERTPYLYGPELLTQVDSVRILAEGLGVERPEIEELPDEGAAAEYMIEALGMPPSVAKFMSGRWAGSGKEQVFGYPVTEKELGNVERYGGGRKGTTFLEWVEKNKGKFLD